jgi:hypothetical protein
VKDFISRLTFGFVMAQLFPGAVTVFAITFAYLSFEGELPDQVVASTDMVLRKWQQGDPAHLLFLAGLFVAFGMLIHGVHWTVLGALERTRAEAAVDPSSDSMFDLQWDRRPIAVHLFTAPARLFRELVLVGRRKGFVQTSIRENVARISSDFMKQHEFMQDFYLYTAQFFAHTAYALMLCVLALSAYMIRFDRHGMVTYGFSPRRLFLLILLYFGTSAFFILARVQLHSLFRAEQDLIAKSEERAAQATPTTPA